MVRSVVAQWTSSRSVTVDASAITTTLAALAGLKREIRSVHIRVNDADAGSGAVTAKILKGGAVVKEWHVDDLPADGTGLTIDYADQVEADSNTAIAVSVERTGLSDALVSFEHRLLEG